MSDRPSVCVFCGSSSGARPEFSEAARSVGTLLAERNVGLVYGGGRVGLMGVVADAALARGGRVVGVIPEALAIKEVAHHGLTELHVVPGMHERKAMMAERSTAFLTLPGGVGTFEEFFEILSWAVLGIHAKPIGLLNVGGYFDPLLAMLHHGVAERLIRPAYLELVLADTTPARLIERLLTQPETTPFPKWIDLDQT